MSKVYACDNLTFNGDVYVTGMGAVIRKIHSLEQCFGEDCVIHNPSSHPMSGFPTHWRTKTGEYEIGRALMERICPHGIGHPDPDHIAAVKKLRGKKEAKADSVHGCDGCCTGDYEEVSGVSNA